MLGIYCSADRWRGVSLYSLLGNCAMPKGHWSTVLPNEGLPCSLYAFVGSISTVDCTCRLAFTDLRRQKCFRATKKDFSCVIRTFMAHKQDAYISNRRKSMCFVVNASTATSPYVAIPAQQALDHFILQALVTPIFQVHSRGFSSVFGFMTRTLMSLKCLPFCGRRCSQLVQWYYIYHRHLDWHRTICGC